MATRPPIGTRSLLTQILPVAAGCMWYAGIKTLGQPYFEILSSSTPAAYSLAASSTPIYVRSHFTNSCPERLTSATKSYSHGGPRVLSVNRSMTENLRNGGSEQGDRPDEEAHAKSIAELFQEHNRSLIRFLTARLRSAQEAEEVAQEAYVRLLRLDQPGTVSFLRAFLYKTAANLAVDRMRKRGRHSVAAEAGYFEDFRKPPTPDREVEGSQEIEHVLRLLEDLPPKCRRAFLLHKIDELEFADVARQMGLSERMVRIYVIRAVLYVRAGLDAEEICQGGSDG